MISARPVIFWLLGLILLIADRYLKKFAVNHLGGKFFIYYQNYNFGFGLNFNRQLIWFGYLAGIICLIYFIKRCIQFYPPNQCINRLFFIYLIILGALSNLWDRLILGYIVDYWNLFNLAYLNLADVMVIFGLLGFMFINRTMKQCNHEAMEQ